MENILFDFISKYVDINEDEKNALIELDIFKSYKKGTVLLEQGQKSDFIQNQIQFGGKRIEWLILTK